MLKDKENRDTAGEKTPYTRFDMGGVPDGSKFFRCLECHHVWYSQERSSCPKCHSSNVTQCSEYVYESYMKNKNQGKAE